MEVKYQSFLALQASAGSGKTFSLSLHYIFLLFKDKYLNPHEILALTFTRKAANEMKQKITHALKLLASSDEELDDEKRHEKKIYLEALRDYGGVSSGEILQRASQVYRKFLGSKPAIMTLDSFFHIILRKFCWYAQAPHDFITQHDIDPMPLMDHFLAHLNPRVRNELLDLSIEEQWYSLHESYRFFENIFEKSYESPDLLADFNGELRFDENVCLNLAKEVQARVLQDEKASARAKNAVEFEHFSDLLSKTWLQKSSARDYQYFKKLQCLDEIEPLIIRLKDELARYLMASEDRILHRIREILILFKQSLKSWHKQHRILSVQDVMLLVHHLLRSRTINTDFLYFRLDSRITHILIDEFQDTSILQFQILEPLIDEILSGFTRQHDRSFFYVGDVKQSIYYFRGSNPKLFLSLSEQKHIALDHLKDNWRSKRAIVEFVNETFKGVYQEAFVPQNAQNEGGYVSVTCVSDDDLVDRVVCVVKDLLEAGIMQEDIALLTFQNNDIITIGDALKEAIPNILIVKEGSTNLIEHIEVKALRYALLYVQNKEAKIHKVRFLSLINNRQEDSFLDNLQLSKPALILKAVMDHFALFSLSARKFLELSLSSNCQDIESFLEWIEGNHEKQPKEQLKGIRILTIHSSKGLEFPHTIVCDCLGRNNNRKDNLLFSYEDIRLQRVFTRKADKEFFILPYQEALLQEKSQLEREHNNLLYVALTRAKSSLHIIQKQKNSYFAPLNLEPYSSGVLSVDKVIEESSSVEAVALSDQKDFGRQNLFLRKEHAHLLRDPYPTQTHTQRLSPIQASLRGEAFHWAFELFLKYQMSDDEVFGLLYNRFGYTLGDEEIPMILEKCKNILKNPLFLEFLSKGRVKCEVSFLDGDCIRRIDLLIIGDEEVCIIDYKSGNPNKEEYIRQVQSYMRIASDYYKKPARGYILTLEGTFITIE